jgi:hypothetical protein
VNGTGFSQPGLMDRRSLGCGDLTSRRGALQAPAFHKGRNRREKCPESRAIRIEVLGRAFHSPVYRTGKFLLREG